MKNWARDSFHTIKTDLCRFILSRVFISFRNLSKAFVLEELAGEREKKKRSRLVVVVSEESYQSYGILLQNFGSKKCKCFKI